MNKQQCRKIVGIQDKKKIKTSTIEPMILSTNLIRIIIGLNNKVLRIQYNNKLLSDIIHFKYIIKSTTY